MSTAATARTVSARTSFIVADCEGFICCSFDDLQRKTSSVFRRLSHLINFEQFLSFDGGMVKRRMRVLVRQFADPSMWWNRLFLGLLEWFSLTRKGSGVRVPERPPLFTATEFAIAPAAGEPLLSAHDRGNRAD